MVIFIAQPQIKYVIMKKYYLFLLLLLVPICTWSQVKQRSLYRLQTIAPGEKWPLEGPSSEAIGHKIRHVVDKEETKYIIMLVEYLQGKKIDDSSDPMELAFSDKGSKIRWELVVDTTSASFARVFALLPNGGFSHRICVPRSGKHLNYVYIPYEPTLIYDQDIPLCLIYEEDSSHPKQENWIKTFIEKNKSLKDFPFSRLERYFLIFYHANQTNTQ